MMKICADLFKRNLVARMFGVLFIVLCTLPLAGCGDEDISPEGGNEENAVLVEKQSATCFMCPLFELAFNVIRSTSKEVVPSVARSAISLLNVGFLLWLAIFILKLVSSMAEPSPGQLWNGIAKQSVLVAIDYVLLRDLAGGGEASIITMIGDPVFSGFVDAGLTILQSVGADVPCGPGGTPDVGMLCLVEALQNKLNIAIGFSSLITFVAMNPFLCLVAAGIWVVSIYMMVYFPMLLIDCVFQYGILLCMTPLFAVSYAFASTRSYCGKGGKALVEIGMAVVGMCVFSAVAVKIIGKYVELYIPFVRTPADLLGDPKGMYEKVMGPGVTGLIFVFIFLICFADVLMGVMQKFSGGVGGLGGTAAGTFSGIKQMAKTAGKMSYNRAKRLKGHMDDKKMLKDMKTKETLEAKKAAGGKLTGAENKQLRQANKKLADKGLVDKKGNRTDAYDGAKDAASKSGVRSYLAGFREDLNDARS